MPPIDHIILLTIDVRAVRLPDQSPIIMDPLALPQGALAKQELQRAVQQRQEGRDRHDERRREQPRDPLQAHHERRVRPEQRVGPRARVVHRGVRRERVARLLPVDLVHVAHARRPAVREHVDEDLGLPRRGRQHARVGLRAQVRGRGLRGPVLRRGREGDAGGELD